MPPKKITSAKEKNRNGMSPAYLEYTITRSQYRYADHRMSWWKKRAQKKWDNLSDARKIYYWRLWEKSENVQKLPRCAVGAQWYINNCGPSTQKQQRELRKEVREMNAQGKCISVSFLRKKKCFQSAIDAKKKAIRKTTTKRNQVRRANKKGKTKYNEKIFGIDNPSHPKHERYSKAHYAPGLLVRKWNELTQTNLGADEWRSTFDQLFDSLEEILKGYERKSSKPVLNKILLRMWNFHSIIKKYYPQFMGPTKGVPWPIVRNIFQFILTDGISIYFPGDPWEGSDAQKEVQKMLKGL